MEIAHIAIWTERLEELRDFYVRYFEGVSNGKYTNPSKGFESYFVAFGASVPAGTLRLLQVLAPDEQGFYDEGMGETNEKIDKLKASCPDEIGRASCRERV